MDEPFGFIIGMEVLRVFHELRGALLSLSSPARLGRRFTPKYQFEESNLAYPMIRRRTQRPRFHLSDKKIGAPNGGYSLRADEFSKSRGNAGKF